MITYCRTLLAEAERRPSAVLPPRPQRRAVRCGQSRPIEAACRAVKEVRAGSVRSEHPGPIEGDITQCRRHRPAVAPVPGGNLVLDPSKDFTLEVKWKVFGAITPVWLAAPDQNWEVNLHGLRGHELPRVHGHRDRPGEHAAGGLRRRLRDLQVRGVGVPQQQPVGSPGSTSPGSVRPDPQDGGPELTNGSDAPPGRPA
jgi:hypothetical protein